MFASDHQRQVNCAWIQGKEGTIVRAAVTNWVQERKASSRKREARQKEDT